MLVVQSSLAVGLGLALGLGLEPGNAQLFFLVFSCATKHRMVAS